MKITEFRIRRYRAFEDDCPIPISDFTVLTGPNNLGKSTVLRALGLFFSCIHRTSPMFRSHDRIRYKYRDDYPKACQTRPGRKPQTRFSARVSLSPEDQADASEVGGISLPAELELAVEFDRKVPYLPMCTCKALGGQEIVRFLTWFGQSFRYIYVPAIRNVEDFKRSIFSELVDAAIGKLRQSKRRVSAVEKFYVDVKTQISRVEEQLARELCGYLPNVKRVSLVLDDLELLRLVSVVDVEIDDGANTGFELKGDGFKSLFALSAVQYMAKQRYAKNLVFGIEEPESHLHSAAVYKVKSSLRRLSTAFQVIVTTHSPILIQRDAVASNLIVDQAPSKDFACKVAPANNLMEIRGALGIQPQDNMTTAEVVVVVEGSTEANCLGAIVARCADAVARPISNGRIKILSAGSASKMVSVVRALARDAASCIVLVDDDMDGKKAADEIKASGLVDNADVFRVSPRDGCLETEFEDLFEPTLYLGGVAEAMGIDLGEGEFAEARQQSGGSSTKMKKWSDVMSSLAKRAGKDWDAVKEDAKTAFARAIAAGAARIIPDQHPLFRSIALRVLFYLNQ